MGVNGHESILDTVLLMVGITRGEGVEWQALNGRRIDVLCHCPADSQ